MARRRRTGHEDIPVGPQSNSSRTASVRRQPRTNRMGADLPVRGGPCDSVAVHARGTPDLDDLGHHRPLLGPAPEQPRHGVVDLVLQHPTSVTRCSAEAARLRSTSRRVSSISWASSPGAKPRVTTSTSPPAAVRGVDAREHQHEPVVGQVAAVAQHALGDVASARLVDVGEPDGTSPTTAAWSPSSSSTSPLSSTWMRSSDSPSGALDASRAWASCAWSRHGWARSEPAAPTGA